MIKHEAISSIVELKLNSHFIKSEKQMKNNQNLSLIYFNKYFTFNSVNNHINLILTSFRNKHLESPLNNNHINVAITLYVNILRLR